ncbi:alkaline phosphatase-like [Cylas formicarius]|uniref:alkaline phosphatase-like n=1 Tax=Cylas formicarius TaxID=197179 RepID=UPI0029587B94|nr:alkaline phosphatase-like [Cylas formicarius]
MHLRIFILFSCLSCTVFCVKEGADYWRNVARQELLSSLKRKTIERPAKNVILFVGDGMGLTTITASRIYSKGEQGYLAWEKFTNVGILKVYSANKLVPDSCSTATAIFSGVKANHKTSGVDATVEFENCPASLVKSAQLDSIITWALEAAKSTGFVTTTRVTHATPSALYAHTPNRKWECESTVPENSRACKDIARQLVEDYPGKNINVIMGGGKQCLQSDVTDSDADPIDTWSCYSRDGRNLIDDWADEKKTRNVTYQVLHNNADLENLDLNAEYTLGVFANGHLKHDYERDRGPQGMPSLTNMTEKAIRLLEKNENGYLLMVEGGMIDQAHHRGHARKALGETASLSDAVGKALEITKEEETLIIVTSDHSHSMVITGYPDREAGVLSYTNSAMDNRPFTSLIYGTGGPNNYQFTVENNTAVRQDPSHNNTADFDYSQQALVYTDEVTHAGTDVLVYANGPMAHLFNSLHEQNYVAYAIAYATRTGEFRSAEQASSLDKDRSCKSPEPWCLIFIALIAIILSNV